MPRVSQPSLLIIVLRDNYQVALQDVRAGRNVVCHRSQRLARQAIGCSRRVSTHLNVVVAEIRWAVSRLPLKPTIFAQCVKW